MFNNIDARSDGIRGPRQAKDYALLCSFRDRFIFRNLPRSAWQYKANSPHATGKQRTRGDTAPILTHYGLIDACQSIAFVVGRLQSSQDRPSKEDFGPGPRLSPIRLSCR